jgi:hypothetical protein
MASGRTTTSLFQTRSVLRMEGWKLSFGEERSKNHIGVLRIFGIQDRSFRIPLRFVWFSFRV